MMHIRIFGSRGWWRLPWSRISPSMSLDACTYFNLLFAAAAALSFAMANGPSPPLPLLPMHSLARCPMPPLPNLTYIPPSLERDSVAPLAAERCPHPTRYFSSESVRACVRAPLSVLSVHPFHGQVSEAMWWSPLYSPAPLDSGASLYFRSSQIDGVTGGNG